MVPLLSAATGNANRTNILVIMADDMGFSDIASYGGEIPTPHLDRLAQEGVRFTQFYNMARCGPTRASLLTGLYPHQAGKGQWDNHTASRPPAYQGFHRNAVTIAEVLREAGYNTYMSGKWHLGERPEEWPVERGFMRHWGLIGGAASFFHPTTPDRPEAQPNVMALDDQEWEVPEGFYMTDATTDFVVKFLDEQSSSQAPFFLYVAYTAPHWPLHAWPEDIARHKGNYEMGWDALREQRFARLQQLGIFGQEARLAPRDKRVLAWDQAPAAMREKWTTEMEIYAAMIEVMDNGIGRILAKLEEMGAAEKTLVVFLSDNGGCHTTPHDPNNGPPGSAGSFPSYGFPGANVSNTPFRFFKQWSHEGGIATPLIARLPGRTTPGRIERRVGHVIDLMPTALALAGARHPPEYRGLKTVPLEGVSLLPLLENHRSVPERTLFWEHTGHRGVRHGDWKLVAQKNTPWELYNLAEDRCELDNLIAQHPGRVRALETLWEDWARKVGVDLPLD